MSVSPWRWEGWSPSESTGPTFSREIKLEVVRLEINRRGINSPMKTIGSTRDTSSLMELRGSLRSLLPTFQKPRRETITQHIVSTLFLKPTFENRSANEQKSYLGVCYHWRVGAFFVIFGRTAKGLWASYCLRFLRWGDEFNIRSMMFTTNSSDPNILSRIRSTNYVQNKTNWTSLALFGYIFAVAIIAGNSMLLYTIYKDPLKRC